MKKIRMLQGMVGADESWAPGDEREVEDHIADAWCTPEAGIAELVSPPKSATVVETAALTPPKNAALAPVKARKGR